MAAKTQPKRAQRPPQKQRPPGVESKMQPRPQPIRGDYRGSGKLLGKVAIITGGDSGIGRAVAVAFAREGADVAIVYLNEQGDAHETAELDEAAGRKCLLLAGDVGRKAVCHAPCGTRSSEWATSTFWSTTRPSSIR